jgi:probable O-glycosylation ligase (exosortase A-associated)
VRSVVLFIELALLLPVALVQPIVGVMLWSWISFMNPHRLVYGGIALSAPWAMLSFAVTVIGFVLQSGPKRIPMNAVTALICVFLVMISVTTVFALAPMAQVLDKYELVFKTFVFLPLTAALLTSRRRINALVWVMVLSLGYFGIRGGGFTLINGGGNKVLGPPNSMIYDNNHIAVAMLVAVPLMNYLRMESRHALIRLGLLATMLLTVLAVVGTYSRGALLALGAVGGFLWLKSPHKLVTGLAIAVVLGAAVSAMPDKWIDRMKTIENYQADGSAMGRLEIWHVASVMAIKRPLTGGGFFAPYTQQVVDQFVPGALSRAVHSIWFEVLGEHGFPTFFVWIGISIAGAVYARRTIRQAQGVPELEWCVRLAKMGQVAMIAYLVGGTFLSLCYWDYYFTILVIIAATYEHVRVTLTQGVAPPLINTVPLRPPIAVSRQAISGGPG